MVVQESFGFLVMAANAAAPLFGSTGGNTGGFCCTASGSLKLTKTSGGATVVDTIPVTAGVFLPLPFVFSEGITATLTGGAAGTFAVN